MAKSTRKKKTSKRQPTSKRLPFNATENTESVANSQAAATSKSRKTKTAKRSKKRSTAKPTKAQNTEQLTATKRKKKQRQLSIWLGPRLRLVISVKRLMPKPKYGKGKVGRPTKKQLLKTKRRRTASATVFITLGLLGSVYFGMNSLKSPAAPIVYSPPAPQIIETTPAKPNTLKRSEPVHLRIPGVGIDTSLIQVGRKDDGSMQVPEPASVAGWYRHSPTPGELGPSIIVGHVDSLTGPAVFWRLGELKPGQIIEIKRADGKTVKFKVNTIKQFEQSNFPTKEVYGNINHAGLRLITCGGSFNRLTGQYSHNTVVYATLVN